MKTKLSKFKNNTKNFLVDRVQNSLGNIHLGLKYVTDKVELAEGNLMRTFGEDRWDVVRSRRAITHTRQEKHKHNMVMLKRRIRSWTDIPSREVDEIINDLKTE
jgi:hypothetical protein